MGERSNFENRNSYDYFISFHRNAYEPEKARGVETYTYLSASTKAKVLAEKIQAGIVSIAFVNRGVKTANYHVLRETRCPAVLIEMGFIDNSSDNALFDRVKTQIVKVPILAQLGIAYVEPSAPPQAENGQTLYRVMAGAYLLGIMQKSKLRS